MGKDSKKSFYIKASNRLMKFIKEYEKDPEARTYFEGRTGIQRDLSIEEWLRQALTTGPAYTANSKNLSEIRYLYRQAVLETQVDDVVERLMNQAITASVLYQ